MARKIFTLSILFILFGCLDGLAQSFTLQGRVTDKDNNPIELCSVHVTEQGQMTMTNLKGEFSMQLHSADSVVVRFSMVGYKSKTRILRNPKGKQTLQIQLYDDNSLEEVVVEGKTPQHGTTIQLEIRKMQDAPSATGNTVEEMVQSQAGVSTHNELTSQYNVRGGSFDENSVYINNVEVYRPFLVRSGQQEGLSIINPYMVESVGFSSGGYESKYGDKMSSALDIQYKRMKPKQFEASVAASLLGASAYAGFGIKHLSWLNSVRYKTNRYLLGSMETKGEYNPNFLDYQTYLSWQPSKRWQVDLIGNISENHYNFEPEDRETKFGTQKSVKSFRVYFDGHEKDIFRTYFGNISITRRLSDHTQVSLIGSAFSTNEQERYDIQGQYWLTQTETSENLGVGTYMEHTRNYLKADVQSLKLMVKHHAGQHNIEGALTHRWEYITENTREYEYHDSAGYSVPHTGKDLYMIYSLDAHNKLNAKRTEAYLQDTWHFRGGGDSIQTLYTLNYGVRFAHWDFNGESLFSPRLSLSIVPARNHNMTLRFATGLYYQAPFFKELRDTSTVNGITYATLNRKIKSQRSIHFIASLDYRFTMMERQFKFTGEVYYKALSNLVPYSVNNVKVVYYGNNLASGHAAGIDLKLFGEFVKGSDSWLTLSVMNTRMKLNGKSIPLPTDQQYALNLYFTDFFPGTTRWKMSLKLAYADGLPFSAPHQELERSSFRAPAYKRADIGMSYRLFNNEDRHSDSIFKNMWLGVDCLNLFGISNVNSYYWITDVTNQQYAVPNYLTGRQINARVLVEF